MEWESGNEDECRAQLYVDDNGESYLKVSGEGWKVPGAQHGAVRLGNY